MTTGSSLAVLTNDTTTQSAGVSFRVDTESFIKSPPFSNGVIYNTTFPGTPAPHTLFISKSDESPPSSNLTILNIV